MAVYCSCREGRGAPPNLWENDGGQCRREPHQVGHPGRVLLLPRSHRVYGQPSSTLRLRAPPALLDAHRQAPWPHNSCPALQSHEDREEPSPPSSSSKLSSSPQRAALALRHIVVLLLDTYLGRSHSADAPAWSPRARKASQLRPHTPGGQARCGWVAAGLDPSSPHRRCGPEVESLPCRTPAMRTGIVEDVLHDAGGGGTG
jgi:hypothetical protein